jgi:hypothetical protein
MTAKRLISMILFAAFFVSSICAAAESAKTAATDKAAMKPAGVGGDYVIGPWRPAGHFRVEG